RDAASPISVKQLTSARVRSMSLARAGASSLPRIVRASSAERSMCSTRRRSCDVGGSGGILKTGRAQHRLPNLRRDAAERREMGLAAKEVRKVHLESAQREQSHVSGRGVDQYIDVSLWSEGV